MFVHEREINGKKTKKQNPTLTEAVLGLTNHIAWIPKWMTGEEQNHRDSKSDGQAQGHR